MRLIKGGIIMRHFMGIFLKGAVGLTATLVMATALPVQAAPTPDQASLLAGPNAPQSGAVLLAQNTEPPKEKQPSPAPPPKEPKALKTMGAPPSPQMERMEKSVIRDEPAKGRDQKNWRSDHQGQGNSRRGMRCGIKALSRNPSKPQGISDGLARLRVSPGWTEPTLTSDFEANHVAVLWPGSLRQDGLFNCDTWFL